MPTKLTAAQVTLFNQRFVEGGKDECWNWNRRYDSFGNPLFSFGHDTRISARPLMYELRCGPVPKGRFVLPSCRNKRCVNPSHLVLSSTPAIQGGDACPPILPGSNALVANVLSALDDVSSLDLPAIRQQINTCETRLATLRAIEWLALGAGRAVEPVRAPAPPKMIAAKPAPAKKSPVPAKKQPVSKQPPRAKLALRMVYFVASAGPRSIAELAAAMDAKPESIEFQTKSSWFIRSGDKVDVSDAGRAVALEGKP